MPDSKKTVPDKRRLTVLVIMILLLLLSLLPYFFYYVPANEARLQDYGFLKLNRAKSNIIQKDADLRNYYGNISQNGRVRLKPADLLACNKTNALLKPQAIKTVTQYFFSPNQVDYFSFILKIWLRIRLTSSKPIPFRQQDLSLLALLRLRSYLNHFCSFIIVMIQTQQLFTRIFKTALSRA